MRTALFTAAVALSGATVILSVPAAATPVTAAAPATGTAVASTPTVCATDTVTPGVVRRGTYVWHRLRTAGYSPAASAAVLGNLDLVSGLTPVAVSTDGTRTGLALWPQARWSRYLSAIAIQRGNPWTLEQQTTFLLLEMAGDPGTFAHERFMTRVNPRKAAAYFHLRFLPLTEDAALSRSRGLKARTWLEALQAVPVDKTPSDKSTYGIVVPCDPPGATLSACPAVPTWFKTFFNQWTGLTWDLFSTNAQFMSRCVYANFPRITVHGSYYGHMPDWQHAIDFMMPGGCRTTPTPHTTLPSDTRMGTRLARYLFDHAAQFGVDYMIWQDHIRNPGEHSDENAWAALPRWRQDGYNNGDCTNTHFDHVHTSVYS